MDKITEQIDFAKGYLMAMAFTRPQNKEDYENVIMHLDNIQKEVDLLKNIKQ